MIKIFEKGDLAWCKHINSTEHSKLGQVDSVICEESIHMINGYLDFEHRPQYKIKFTDNTFDWYFLDELEEFTE